MLKKVASFIYFFFFGHRLVGSLKQNSHDFNSPPKREEEEIM